MSLKKALSEKAAYGEVAVEYYDAARHPTCSNFNELSRIYLGRAPIWHNAYARILEVGAGSSAVASILSSRGSTLEQLTITDVSEAMISHSRGWASRGATLRLMDAECTDLPDGSVDLLVSSLGDPYNTQRFWSEASRILCAGGLVAFTIPSFQWAARFRSGGAAQNLFRAEFLTREGRVIYVPSTILPLEDQVAMIEYSGLVVLDFKDLGADELGTSPKSPKTAVFADQRSSLVWGFVALKQSTPLDASVRNAWQFIHRTDPLTSDPKK